MAHAHSEADSTPVAQVRWIDDSFYSAICSAKDASATFISIVTSVVNVVVQSITQTPVTYMETGAQRVDSNFQAFFTMAMTSVNNLLNQICLGLFYPFLAMQKVLVCNTNTVTALVANSGFKISIGIPEIQVTLQSPTATMAHTPTDMQDRRRAPTRRWASA